MSRHSRHQRSGGGGQNSTRVGGRSQLCNLETPWPSTDLGFLTHEVKLNYTALQTLLTLKLYNSTTQRHKEGQMEAELPKGVTEDRAGVPPKGQA